MAKLILPYLNMALDPKASRVKLSRLMDLLRAAWLECNVDVNPGRVLVLDYGKKVSSAHQVKCIYHDPSFLQIGGLQKGFEF